MNEGDAKLGGTKTFVRDSLDAPGFFPPVTEVIIGTDGRIWLAREGLIPPPPIARRYDVLDAGGRPAGMLTLERPGRIMAATSDAVWIVETDADDVPTLLRYPIVRR